MWKRLTQLFKRTEIKNSDVYNSSVNIIVWLTSPKFKVTEKWLVSVLSKHYSGEMAAKYIPELHQIHDFEKRHLQDILDFGGWLEMGQRQINAGREALDNFKKQYELLYIIKNSEQLIFVNPEHDLLTKSRELNDSLSKIYKELSLKEKHFRLPGYKILDRPDALEPVLEPVPQIYPENTVSLIDVFTRKAPSDHFIIAELISAYNQVHNTIGRLNRLLEFYKKQRNHRIIHGIAGTGKTHTSAYLVKQQVSKGDYVIFVNAKSFNGDGVDFEERLHQMLDIPHGVRLGMTLTLLNKFARKKGKRIFIVFDALNETTKENLGFSNIWNEQLQLFINAIRDYSHLYFVCTLRTSYLSSIWEGIPAGAVELTDMRRYDDVLSMCRKYFDYYRIEVSNLDNADLSYFSVPLLLDLYCKLINEDRAHAVTVSLDIKSYMQVFEGYVDRLIQEVQQKRQLAARQPIEAGLRESSDRFMTNIGGTISVDDFVLSFDQPNTRLHDSIAQPMLEGYLLFIRDRITKNQEIVRHTQQQIGGYLLAIRLADRFPEPADLIASTEFSEQINGANPAMHHQLRLDILQFLILLKPELVDFLTEQKAFEEGWWYLFNSPDKVPETAESLIENPLSLSVLPFILAAGAKRVFDPIHPYNFKFVLRLLEKYEAWDFDLNWTFYLYTHAEDLYDEISERLELLKLETPYTDSEEIVALYIALVNATTVRALRDLATLYLLEFGKQHPMSLLKVAQRTVSLNDVYIYERVIHSLYGVVLNSRHDQRFISEVLPVVATQLFDLQFSTEATNPMFNYIVIDSIKHILDFAQQMAVWTASEADLENVRLYRSPALPEWTEPSQAQLELVQEHDERDPPNPIGMDFAIYTIPRLIDSQKYELRTPAVANVLKRVYELGYKEDTIRAEDDEQLKAFAFGHTVSFPGKVDKIGKKYNWKSYFDYAGVLLQRGLLDIYSEFGKPDTGYKRLSDVGIDISNPSREFEVAVRVYQENLIDNPASPDKWTAEVKIETIEPYFVMPFDDHKYVMLKGLVEQKVGSSYESRSFIMAETCFIERNEDFEELKTSVCTKVFDWNGDLHLSPAYSSNTYFGEYYFGDNQISEERDTYSIKTGATIIRKTRVTPGHVFEGNFRASEINQIKEMTAAKFLHFDGEGSLIQYLNESDSEIFKRLSRYIPTVKMGKYLGLRSDPSSGLILDTGLQKMLVTINFVDGHFKNEFTYIRVDLLKSYLDAHNYALLYQNKQHSYAKNVGNNRYMKYAVIDQF